MTTDNKANSTDSKYIDAKRNTDFRNFRTLRQKSFFVLYPKYHDVVHHCWKRVSGPAYYLTDNETISEAIGYLLGQEGLITEVETIRLRGIGFKNTYDLNELQQQLFRSFIRNCGYHQK